MNAFIKKVTDIPWLATDIPSNWEVKRFKDIFVESDEVSKSGKEDLLSVSEYYGVARRKDKMAEEEYESRAESLEGYKICHKGDLVSNIMLTWKKALGVSDFYGIVSPAYAVYKGINIYPKYYHYLLRSDMYAAEFRRQSKGIIDSRLRLYTDRFYAIKTLYPPIDEQKQIANYLDEKITAINATIAARDKELGLLKKFKRSKVAEVLMRGLTPNVPTKSSPLGEIPAHWEVQRLKNFASTIKGKAADYYDEPIDGAELVLSVEVLRGAASPVLNYAVCSDPEQHCTSNDIVVIWDGAGVGEFLRAKEGLIASTTAKFVLDKKKIYSNYFWYFGGRVEEIQKNMPTGMGIPHVSPNILNNTELAVPPLEEQVEISKYLDEECEKIDRKCSLIDGQIKKLQLLKRALINEVVTGKRQLA